MNCLVTCFVFISGGGGGGGVVGDIDHFSSSATDTSRAVFAMIVRCPPPLWRLCHFGVARCDTMDETYFLNSHRLVRMVTPKVFATDVIAINIHRACQAVCAAGGGHLSLKNG